MGKIEVIGPCTVHDGFCFQSPNYPSSYAKNQSCTITVTSAAGPDDILMVEAFNTVSDSDILTVGSTECSGWGGPWGWASEGLRSPGEPALERSRTNNRRKLGFSICLVPECLHGDGAKANDGRCSCGPTSLCTPASKSYCYSPQSLCAEYPNPRKSFLTVTSGVARNTGAASKSRTRRLVRRPWIRWGGQNAIRLHMNNTLRLVCLRDASETITP